MPSSPSKVVTVLEASGVPLAQVVIGSSANPGLRDFAMAAAMVRGRHCAPGLSFDVNPTSRELLLDLTRMGATFDLIAAGARLHQAGCLGCIGMGQAPAAGTHSLRTFPRNVPGRSGTSDDNVWLCSPETAAASALRGRIEDPRAWAYREGVDQPKLDLPERATVERAMFEPPLQPARAGRWSWCAGPTSPPCPSSIRCRSVSTDRCCSRWATTPPPTRSPRPEPRHCRTGPTCRSPPTSPSPGSTRTTRPAPATPPGRTWSSEARYGQGSSREHAAITPCLLGLRAVLAKSYARIHWQNLANFGVLALEFTEPGDYDRIDQGDRLEMPDLHAALSDGDVVVVHNATKDQDYRLTYHLSPRQLHDVLAGGAIPAHAARGGVRAGS